MSSRALLNELSQRSSASINLYLVVLGGKVNGGHIEMHDVRWVVGETIESTIPQLKSQWVGNTSGLHIDSYKLIEFVDGYRIKIATNNEANDHEVNKLWFINLGGYKDGEPLEQHHIELVIASSVNIAKKKAHCKWSEQMKQVHTDNHASIINLEGY